MTDASAPQDDLADRLELLGIRRDSYEVRPLNRVQKFIAQRLTEASRDIPTFPLEMNVGLDALIARRAEFNASGDVRISVNDLLIKAAALALKSVPEVNASFTADGLILHREADIAVAVATDAGLITPIVRAADTKPVTAISEAMRDFVARAKQRKLKPDEYTGGTFSVSNLGMFGVSRFGSIINPPHAAILSIGAGEERVVVRDGAVGTATMMAVTLTCDHRVIDGATGARWLQAFRALVEDPGALFG